MTKDNKIILFWLTLSVLGCVFSSFLGANNYVKNTVQAKGIPEIRVNRTQNMQSGSSRVTTGGTHNTVSNFPIENEIEKTFGKFSPLMKKIAFCESSLDSKNVSKDGNDIGLFQIRYTVHHVTKSDMLDYKKNIAFAKKLFDRDGISPWFSSMSCWSK